ncbi:MAG: hypothetical protein DDT25_01339 [Chloroflexi bacterium]|nr:hypothetical protein [Chloroflexota bacterium]
MSNPEREQFNPEPTGEQYEKKEKVQKVIDIYEKYEKTVQERKKKEQEVAELYNQGDELWEEIPDIFPDALSFGEVYGRIEKIGGQMYRKNAERISAKETIRNIEEIRGALNTKESKEFFLKMDNEKKEGIFRFFSRSGGLRDKVRELIEQEAIEGAVDSAEIPKTGKGTEGAETAEREQ